MSACGAPALKSWSRRWEETCAVALRPLTLMPGYLAVKALPIFPTNVVSKCAVYHVTSPSAFALAARSANSSSARAGACAAKIANEDNTGIAQSNFMFALHRVGVGSGIRFGLAPTDFPWRRQSPQIE